MLGRYNLTPANRKGGKTEEYEFSASFYGTVSALMGAGINIELERFMDGQMTAKAELRFGYDAKMNTEANLNAETVCRMMVIKKADYSAEINANVQRVIEEVFRADGSIDAKLEMIPNVNPGGELFGDVNALWNSVQIKETVMRFDNIVIPPGSTVVIDSEFFMAMLDGESIVDLYEGDWLMLTNKLMALEARGISSGDLNVSLLYREMYL